MIHHRYRQAKKFALDDDLEVDDKFSTNKKNATKRTWDDIDYERSQGQYGVFKNQVERWINSNIGRSFDTVYAEFLLKIPKEHEVYLRGRFHSNVVQKVEFRDGVPYDAGSKYGGREYPLSAGEVYVHPKTRNLERVPYKKRDPYSWQVKRKIGILELPEIKTKFVLETISHKRKVGPGKFEEIQEKVWMKMISYEKIGMREVTAPNFEKRPKGVGYWSYPRSVFRHMEQYTYLDWTKSTASKREIKQYNLKALE